MRDGPRKNRLAGGVAILAGLVLGACALSAASGAEGPGRSATPAPPDLSFNQDMIEGRRSGCGDLGDVMHMFRMVFSRLPASVRVYPTENYFYFKFDCESREVWGNIRLDAGSRDAGVADFAYFYALNRPEKMEDLTDSGAHRQLGPADGIRLTRVAPLVYDLSFEGHTVRFHLNNVSQTPLPQSKMLPSERFIERVFDESGFQFALLYDETSKAFRFVLDQEPPLPDTLISVATNVLVGRISGFAFFSDSARDRNVLIAVDADNMRRNNYYDGPFDQLGDNFVKDDRRQRAMEEAYPYARGRIDRRGIFLGPDGAPTGQRLALTPFYTYANLDDLREFVTRSRRGAADDEALISALTYDYKKAVPASPAIPAAGPTPPVPPKQP